MTFRKVTLPAVQSGITSAAWTAASVLFLVAFSWCLQTFMTRPSTRPVAEDVIQVLVLSVAFLLHSAAVASRRQGVDAREFAVLGLAFYGLGYAYLFTWPGSGVDRGDFIATSAVGLALTAAGTVFVSIRTVLGLTFLGAVGIAAASASPPPDDVMVRLPSALASLKVSTFSGLVPHEKGSINGGGIESHGDAFLLATSDGQLFDVRLQNGRPTVTASSAQVAPHPPRSRLEFGSEVAATYRLTDILMDATEQPPTLYVASVRYDPTKVCFTLRVERRGATPSAGEATTWTTIFESSPCLPPTKGFDFYESGGRLQKLGNRLLVTVGDFNQLASQRADSSYGKVWAIDPELSRAEVFTIGHRNPQGLLVEDDQHVWETEQGPRGGDELNRLEQGRDYGYPSVTYGTDYDAYAWSRAPMSFDHGAFEEPIFAFPPNTALTSLIKVQGTMFSRWTRDLLIGSLSGESVHRLRLSNGHVLYHEQIRLKQRVRDLAQGRQGEVLLWCDDGVLVLLENAELD